MHRFYFLIYEVRSMFHGRRWRNLSGSNNSMLVIFVNTFLKYFLGSDWLSLAVYTSGISPCAFKSWWKQPVFSPHHALFDSALCAVVGQFKISFFKDVQNILFLTQGVVFGSSQCWLGRFGNWSYLGKYPLDYRKKFFSSIVQAFVIIDLAEGFLSNSKTSSMSLTI